ncbi:hypothetical protein [Nocardia neocaledoniensis]|uniref:hypothetical protein n=1 Tax=Nocardia neocaledoniensis TaxID=236511 RepID=UPI002455E563|nr:hypothetical protein [Nocardia neocaledoniensis]
MNLRRTRMLAVTAVLSLVSAAVGIGPATAQSPTAGDFYQVPDDLPGNNGAIIKSEPVALLTRLTLAVLAIPADATRIIYQSSDTRGGPTATSGIVLNPTTR